MDGMVCPPVQKAKNTLKARKASQAEHPEGSNGGARSHTKHKAQGPEGKGLLFVCLRFYCSLNGFPRTVSKRRKKQ